MNANELVITSLRAIEEALATPRRVIRMVVRTGDLRPRVARVVAQARAAGVRVVYAGPQRIQQYARRKDAQVVLLLAMRELLSFEELIERTAGERAYWVMLWQVTNVGNLGAIIRSAYAFGAHGVIWPQHGMPGLSNDLVHASAGTALRMDLAVTPSVKQAIEYARAAGIETWALDTKGSEPLRRIPADRPHIWLAGAEDLGLSKSLLRKVDRTFRIPMRPDAESLNVAVSTALACYQSSAHGYGLPTT